MPILKGKLKITLGNTTGTCNIIVIFTLRYLVECFFFRSLSQQSFNAHAGTCTMKRYLQCQDRVESVFIKAIENLPFKLFIPQHVHKNCNECNERNAIIYYSDKLSRVAVARFVQNADSLPPDFKSIAMTNDPERMG